MWIRKEEIKEKMKATVMCVFGWLNAMMLFAQINPVTLEQQLEKELQRNLLHFVYPAKVSQFYKSYQYNIAWINRPVLQRQLLNHLEYAQEAGLNKEDYRFSFLLSVCNGDRKLVATTDSLQADFMFTDAAIHFLHELAFGSDPPELGYNGLNSSPSCLNIPSLLASALLSDQFHSILQSVECKSTLYLALKVQYNKFRKMISDSVYKPGGIINSKKPEVANSQLMEKFYYLNLIASPDKEITQKDLLTKIKDAQRLFSLPADGVLTASLIRELNVSLSYRMEELRKAMNTARWIYCISLASPHVILVNIPSASLFVYKVDRSILYSKVIVGKPSTRTPLFASQVTEIVMYPYWMVPKSIATKELLPHIKKNISYLNENAFQVVNEQGRIVNPSSVNWQALSTGYFPYILRQSTGCDNSLGIVKLNFYSPYGVYLHDTPTKNLFNSNRRFFSHGCIRVEKAIALARLLMNQNTITIDTLEEKGCLRNQKPVPIAVSEKMPVLVLYNTAWPDSTGTVRFYPDVYNRFSYAKK
jgi:L,D-transpeptidase YcbB